MTCCPLGSPGRGSVRRWPCTQLQTRAMRALTPQPLELFVGAAHAEYFIERQLTEPFAFTPRRRRASCSVPPVASASATIRPVRTNPAAASSTRVGAASPQGLARGERPLGLGLCKEIRPQPVLDPRHSSHAPFLRCARALSSRTRSAPGETPSAAAASVWGEAGDVDELHRLASRGREARETIEELAAGSLRVDARRQLLGLLGIEDLPGVGAERRILASRLSLTVFCVDVSRDREQPGRSLPCAGGAEANDRIASRNVSAVRSNTVWGSRLRLAKNDMTAATSAR